MNLYRLLEQTMDNRGEDDARNTKKRNVIIDLDHLAHGALGGVEQHDKPVQKRGVLHVPKKDSRSLSGVTFLGGFLESIFEKRQ